jgi:hypothetical protein
LIALVTRRVFYRLDVIVGVSEASADFLHRLVGAGGFGIDIEPLLLSDKYSVIEDVRTLSPRMTECFQNYSVFFEALG